MAAPILPVGTGIGPVTSNPINVGGLGSAEAAFRKDAASGGMLGKLLGMYPTQTEAINARKSAQSGILQAIKNLTSGSGSINPNLVGAAMDGTGVSGMPDPYTADQTMASGDAISSLDIFNPDLSAGGIGSERMPLTGGGDQPGDATFGGTIPEPRDLNLDVDIGAAGTGVEPPVKANNFDGDVLIETKPTIDDGGENDATPKQTPEGGKLSPQEEAFANGMKAYKEALGESSDIGSIDEYKKEFADATGIDISGKVDNSTALMSFGLALMQNKAGKGFNVGKILSSVGEAGEKAMPAMAAAKKEAKAGQIAAGKYALSERKGAIAQALETRKGIAARIAELSDKAYDRDTQMQVERLKAAAKLEDRRIQELGSNQRESIKAQISAGELASPIKLNLGGDGPNEKYEIQVQQVGKTGSFKMVDPEGEMNRVTDKIKAADSQLATVNKMFDIAEMGGVSGAEGFYNLAASRLKGLGISLPGAQPEKIEEYNAAISKLLTQARRLLTGGEAGNAISDKDVIIMEQGMGLVRNDAGEILFSSADQAKLYVRNLQELFQRKKAELVTSKKRLYDFGVKNGEYINYVEPETNQKISENENFADDFAGYEATVVNGKIRYTIKKPKS
jgi:hypothetical protein